MLVDRNLTMDMRLVGGRIPRPDEDTYEVLSEEAIVVYLAYMD